MIQTFYLYEIRSSHERIMPIPFTYMHENEKALSQHNYTEKGWLVNPCICDSEEATADQRKKEVNWSQERSLETNRGPRVEWGRKTKRRGGQRVIISHLEIDCLFTCLMTGWWRRYPGSRVFSLPSGRVWFIAALAFPRLPRPPSTHRHLRVTGHAQMRNPSPLNNYQHRLVIKVDCNS